MPNGSAGSVLAERDREAVSAYEALPLMERKSAPAGRDGPVGVAGWRWSAATAADCRSSIARGQDGGDRESRGGRGSFGGQHWREDKIGLLMTMASEESASDPCPADSARHFADATRILKLARELKTKVAASRGSSEGILEEPEVVVEALSSSGPSAGSNSAPNAASNAASNAANRTLQIERCKSNAANRRASRSRVGRRRKCSRSGWSVRGFAGRDFGPILAQAAWSWGFFAAGSQGFHRRTARKTTGRSGESVTSRRSCRSWISFTRSLTCSPRRWRDVPSRRAGGSYQEWIGWTWKGEVGQGDRRACGSRQAELGTNRWPEDGETHPRQVVARTPDVPGEPSAAR